MRTVWAVFWAAFALAFVALEFLSVSAYHPSVPVAMVGLFLAAELGTAVSGKPYTLSDQVWRFGEAGLKLRGFPVRAVPAWTFALALLWRLGVTAREIDGQTVPYWAQAVPLELMLVGLAAWLAFHFSSGGRYRSGSGV